MYIIKKIADENGSRPPIQTWSTPKIPEGYAVCPDALYEVFYSTSPAGFVNITVESDVVTAMEVNEEALAAYKEYLATHPVAKPSRPNSRGTGVTWKELAEAYREGVNSLDK